MDRVFHVYILAGKSGVLYTGMTSNLARRVYQRKQRRVPGFTQKYNVTRLVWFEPHGRAANAIAREKQIKTWTRAKRIALIEKDNRQWKDLSDGLV